MTRLREVVVIVVTEFGVDGVTARTFHDFLVQVIVVLVGSETPITASATEESGSSGASDGTGASDGMLYLLHLGEGKWWGLRKKKKGSAPEKWCVSVC